MTTSLAILTVSVAVPASAQLDDSYASPDASATTAAAPLRRHRRRTRRRRCPARRPRRRAYDASQPIPPGYHLEQRGGDGLVRGGAVVACAGGTLVILGLVAAAARPNDTYGAGLGLLVGGAVSLTGLLFVVIGSSIPRTDVLIRNEVSLRVAPVVARETVGGSISFAF